MSSAIAVVATITALDGHAATVETALRTAVPAVREEAGCEMYALHRDPANPARFVMIERWRDAAALAGHVAAPAFQSLAATLQGRATLEISKLEPLV